MTVHYVADGGNYRLAVWPLIMQQTMTILWNILNASYGTKVLSFLTEKIISGL